jgi:adenosylcobinamide-GDP ribazoletransferase
LPAAAVAVAADAALTGALHLDGLADTADGLFAHAPSRGRLEIMAEPQVGTFGSVAVGLALLGKAAGLSAIEPSPRLLAALYCSSRSAMVLASRLPRYARDDGLASAFLPDRRPPAHHGSGAADERPPSALQRFARDPAFSAALAGLGAALVLGRRAGVPHGSAAVVGGWVGAVGVVALARRRLGGFTGDVLGAAGVAAETVGLLVAAASRPGTVPERAGRSAPPAGLTL